MLTVQVTADPLLTQWQRSLDDKDISIAAVRALNKTARWLRTQVARDAANSLNISVSQSRQGLVLLHANRQKMQAGVALLKTAGVIKAIQLGRATQSSQGVRVGQHRWEHAFLATMPNGHRGVFRRQGQARLPIQEVQIVVTGRIAKAMQAIADKSAMPYFEKLFVRELGYLTKD